MASLDTLIISALRENKVSASTSPGNSGKWDVFEISCVDSSGPGFEPDISRSPQDFGIREGEIGFAKLMTQRARLGSYLMKPGENT